MECPPSYQIHRPSQERGELVGKVLDLPAEPPAHSDRVQDVDIAIRPGHAARRGSVHLKLGDLSAPDDSSENPLPADHWRATRNSGAADSRSGCLGGAFEHSVRAASGERDTPERTGQPTALRCMIRAGPGRSRQGRGWNDKSPCDSSADPA
jgi:hypothetical protein